MKLSVGMYVRTNYGIGKIEKIKEDEKHKTTWYTLDVALDVHSFLKREQEITSANYYISFLVEVGDYVNGEKVGEVLLKPMYNFGNGIIIKNESGEVIYSNFIYSKYEKIESILTKEQFEKRKYKI